MIKTLLDAGIRLESVREVFTYLRQHVTTDIASANIVISGNQVVLCDGDELVDVLRSGQGVLNVLPLAGVKDDIDAQLVPLDAMTPPATRRRRRRSPRRRGMTLERSPLDAVHRGLGARMVPFGGWEMPLEYPAGTIAEHLACREDAVVFDVSHLGTVRVDGADAYDRLQRDADQRPRQDRSRPGAVHPPARRRRRVGARRHHRVVAPGDGDEPTCST